MLQQNNYLPRWVRHSLSSAAVLLNLGESHFVNENRMDNNLLIPTIVDDYNLDSTDSAEETQSPRYGPGRINDAGYGGTVGDYTFTASAYHKEYNANTEVGEEQSRQPSSNQTVTPQTSQSTSVVPGTSQKVSIDAPIQTEEMESQQFSKDSKDDIRQVRGYQPYQPVRSRCLDLNLASPVNPAVNGRSSGMVNGLSFDASGSPESNSGSRSFHLSENRYNPHRGDRCFTGVTEAIQERLYAHQKKKGSDKPKSPRPDSHEEKPQPQYHQGISSLFKEFTPQEFTWTILKDLDDHLVDRDLEQLKFLCKDRVASSQLSVVRRAYELFELLQNMALISERRFQLLAELMYRIRRIDLLKKLVTDTKWYQQLMKITPTSLSDYRILLHEICEDTIDKEFKTMKFFVREHFRKPKLAEMNEPQHLFTALEQKDRLGPDNLDFLIQMMEAANKQNMVKKITDFRGSYYPENPPPLNVFNQQLEVERMKKPRTYGREATAHFAGGSLGPMFGTREEDMYYRERPVANINDLHGMVDEQLNIGGDFNDSDRPSMLLSVGVEDRSEEELDGSLPCYKMDARPRGLCVIINNKRFHKLPGDDESKELKPREGSDVDRGNLEHIFNYLDFTVEMYENLTAKELVSVLHDYAMNVDHSRYDCFACCILTHGKREKLYGCDGKLIEIRELTNFFKAAFCPSLRGKPKLFFIQACQGREKQQGYTPQERQLRADIQTDDSGQSCEPRDSIPNEADFLLAYATLPGFVSYRSRTHGSWFVNALVENIQRYAHKYDLLSIMIKVNEEVAKMTAPMSDGEFKQVPLPHPTLRKRIFFKNVR